MDLWDKMIRYGCLDKNGVHLRQQGNGCSRSDNLTFFREFFDDPSGKRGFYATIYEGIFDDFQFRSGEFAGGPGVLKGGFGNDFLAE